MELVDYFGDGFSRRIDMDRIVGGNHGANFPVGIASIAFGNLCCQSFQIDRDARPFKLDFSSTSPFEHIRDEEKLARRLRENGSSLVATFGHQRPAYTIGFLDADQFFPDKGMFGHNRNKPRHFGSPYFPGDLVPAKPGAAWLEAKVHFVNPLSQLGKPLQPALPEEFQGDGAVHRPCVQKLKAKTPGERLGHSAFPGPGWAVNRHNHIGILELSGGR
jgi:hypothetical protein